MPAEFNNADVRFQYPDNWTLNEDVALADCRSITVYSPGGAFWTLSVHPRSADPASLAKAVVEVMRGDYKELEVDDVQETISGHQLIGHDLSFYYVDLISTAWIRGVRTDRATYTIFCQAEDREFARIEDVFLAMTTSFLENVRKLSYWD
jgi:hypothetical protein